jgi:hypothetical protein
MKIIDKLKEVEEEFLSDSVISVRNTILYISISQKAQKARKGGMRRFSFRFCDFRERRYYSFYFYLTESTETTERRYAKIFFQIL